MKNYFLPIGLLLANFALSAQVANAQRTNDPVDSETTASRERFNKALIWYAKTNGLEIALLPPWQPPLTQFAIWAKSSSNDLYSWIAPTNEVKFKVGIFNEQGTELQPTNNLIEAPQRLTERVVLADYPQLPHRQTGQRFLKFWNKPIPIDYIDLAQYYDLSQGGKFTIKITPLLYKAETNYIFAKLVEFPIATYELQLPKPEIVSTKTNQPNEGP